MAELIADLRKVGLLAGIGDRHLERIAAVVSAQTVDPGETLVTEGSVGEDLYFVRRGSFVVSVLDGETSAEIARLGPGDVIGETQLIAGGKRTATVRAFDECEVLRLPHAEFDALMAASETLRDAVARVIRHRLREAVLRVALPHAVGPDPELLDLLSARAKWVRLERGQVLWEQGAAADSWYLLVSGELSIIVNEHGVGRKVGSVRRGEVFGEVELIRGEPRSATIMAPRDSWLACFDANLLDEEILTRTGALRTLVLSLAHRLSTQSKAAPDSARVITLLPRGPDTDTEGFVQRLAGSLGANGLVVDSAMLHREGIVGDAEGLPYEHPAWLRFEAWVESRRQDKNYLLLVTSGQNDPWTRMAVDQADTVLLLVNADSDPAQSDAESAILDRALASQALHLWLALEHPADRVIPTGTAAWLEARSVEHHAHLRRGNRRDIARLARWLMGRTLGIALSGGGARGFVHLGVVAAMVESGYEVDLIAGTSAGSMAGGLLACDEPPEKLMERGVVAIEANGNPFVEFDLPIMSILRSRRLRDGLHQIYGEMRIEDSWIPLRILATDLSESRRVVFRTGLVWRRVLAASSPPGVMTPIKEGDHLFCDGGLVDNLPVSILLEENCSVKFASYVGSAPILPAPQRDFPSSWTLLLDKILRRRRHPDVPTLVTTLLQCLSVPAAAQLEDAQKAADLLFHPDLSAYSITDFSACRTMFQAGQTHARAVLKTWTQESPG